MKSRTLYMHTMDDRPAYFEHGRHYEDGGQLVFAGRVFPASGFCASLDEIKQQRAVSIGWRRRQLRNLEDDGTRYDYLRIPLPNDKL